MSHEEHSSIPKCLGLAKKVILYKYCQGRFSHLLNSFRVNEYQFVYLDAFAGNGSYEEEIGVAESGVPFGNPYLHFL